MSKDKFELMLSTAVLSLCQVEFGSKCNIVEVDAIISVTEIGNQGRVDHVYKIHEKINPGVNKTNEESSPENLEKALAPENDADSKRSPEAQEENGVLKCKYPKLLQTLSSEIPRVGSGGTHASNGNGKGISNLGHQDSTNAPSKDKISVALLLSQINIPTTSLMNPSSVNADALSKVAKHVNDPEPAINISLENSSVEDQVDQWRQGASASSFNSNYENHFHSNRKRNCSALRDDNHQDKQNDENISAPNDNDYVENNMRGLLKETYSCTGRFGAGGPRGYSDFGEAVTQKSGFASKGTELNRFGLSNGSKSNLDGCENDTNTSRDTPVVIMEVKEEPIWDEQEYHVQVNPSETKTPASGQEEMEDSQASHMLSIESIKEEEVDSSYNQVYGNGDTVRQQEDSVDNTCISGQNPKPSEYDSILLKMLKSPDSLNAYRPVSQPRHQAISDDPGQTNSLLSRLPHVQFKDLFPTSQNKKLPAGLWSNNSKYSLGNSLADSSVPHTSSKKTHRHSRKSHRSFMKYDLDYSIEDEDLEETGGLVDTNAIDSDSSYCPSEVDSDDSTQKMEMRKEQERKKKKFRLNKAGTKLGKSIGIQDDQSKLNKKTNDNHTLLRQILSAPKAYQEFANIHVQIPMALGAPRTLDIETNDNSCSSSSSSYKSYEIHQKLAVSPFVDNYEHLTLYPCSLCGSEFATKQARDKHEQSEQFEQLLRCPLCSGFFSNEDARREHMVKTHSELDGSEGSVKISMENDLSVIHFKPEDGKLTLFPSQCPNCHIVFKNESKRNIHLVNVHGIKVAKGACYPNQLKKHSPKYDKH